MYPQQMFFALIGKCGALWSPRNSNLDIFAQRPDQDRCVEWKLGEELGTQSAGSRTYASPVPLRGRVTDC